MESFEHINWTESYKVPFYVKYMAKFLSKVGETQHRIACSVSLNHLPLILSNDGKDEENYDKSTNC